MKKHSVVATFSLFIFLLLGIAQPADAQFYFKNAEIYDFQKHEFNQGLHFNFNTEREETQTEFWRDYEELNTGDIKFQLSNRFWNFMVYKQEKIEFNVEIGPLTKISLGNNTSLQDRCILLGDIEIGKSCLFAPNVFISSGRHYFDLHPEMYIKDQDELVQN